MFNKKIPAGKRIIPAFALTETEQSVIRYNMEYKIVPIIACGKKVNCFEFEKDAMDVLDDIECHMLSEAETPSAELRGFATRCSTVAFQTIRELSAINGANLIEVGKSLKVIGRVIALAVVVALANIDLVYARRLLPLVRAI